MTNPKEMKNKKKKDQKVQKLILDLEATITLSDSQMNNARGSGKTDIYKGPGSGPLEKG